MDGIWDKSTKKIAIDARFAQGEGGGINNYLTQLIKYLSEKGCEVITISDKSLGNKFPGTKNIVLKNYFHWMFWEQVQLPIALFKLKPDIYHAAGNWGVPVIRPCRTVLTVHDIIPKILPEYFNRSHYPFISRISYKLRIQIGVTCANSILCDSQSTADNLKKCFAVNPNNINIVPLAIEPEMFNEITGNDAVILGKMGINKPYILNHGGLDFRKNNLRLVEAFANALKQNSKMRDLTLVFTGRNLVIEKEIRETSEKLGIGSRVKFTGWIEQKEVTVLVRNAKIIAYPTLAEGFGMPLLEAMAAGVPIVASNLPVLREVGKDIPVYVNPADVNNIAFGLFKAVNGVGKKKLDKGKLLARQYTWGKALEKTFKVYGYQS